MAFSFNSKTFLPYAVGANSVLYAGPDNTVTQKDQVRLSRVEPKPVTTSSGVGRADFVLTRTVALTGAVEDQRDAIIKIGGQIPVGIAEVDVDELQDDITAYTASAAFKAHLMSLVINVP